jgi:hypothetical protein
LGAESPRWAHLARALRTSGPRMRRVACNVHRRRAPRARRASTAHPMAVDTQIFTVQAGVGEDSSADPAVWYVVIGEGSAVATCAFPKPRGWDGGRTQWGPPRKARQANNTQRSLLVRRKSSGCRGANLNVGGSKLQAQANTRGHPHTHSWMSRRSSTTLGQMQPRTPRPQTCATWATARLLRWGRQRESPETDPPGPSCPRTCVLAPSHTRTRPDEWPGTQLQCYPTRPQ